MSYCESDQFKRKQPIGKLQNQKQFDLLQTFLPYVLNKLPANKPEEIINGIDSFCRQFWMMNLGDDKGKIVKAAIAKFKPKTILELGTFCGYSSLVFAFASKGKVHTFDPNQATSSIAQKVHQHAGLSDLITCHAGTIQNNEEFLKNHGPFDMIFIDHLKNLYLPDLKWLQEKGIVAKGTVVIGDNIIYPGAPDYLQYLKESKDYDSVLYHGNLEYCDSPDAVLVSQRLI